MYMNQSFQKQDIGKRDGSCKSLSIYLFLKAEEHSLRSHQMWVEVAHHRLLITELKHRVNFYYMRTS